MPTTQLQTACNGEKIALLRAQQGMTQDKLARMSGVNIRTIQRAEKGQAVTIETLASLAAALKVTVPDLGILDMPIADNAPIETEDNTVVLKPCTSGMALLNMVCTSFSGKVECQAEPTAENVETLSNLVEWVEQNMPNPWCEIGDEGALSLSDRLRRAVTMNEQLAQLAKQNITVFAGTYTAKAQVPRYDMDEGHKYTTDLQRFEPVTMCRVIVAPSGLSRVVLRVTDQWQEPAPPRITEDAPFGDDIPF